MPSIRTKVFFIFFFLITYFSYSQSSSINNRPLSDSINFLLIQEKTASIKSKKLTDSLQRELLLYKVKDSLYSDEISSLGTLYSAVMAIIATAITGLGVGYVIKTLNDTKTELDNKIKAVADNGVETEEALYSSYLHFLITQAKSTHGEAKRHYNNEQWLSSIDAAMDSIQHYCTISKINSEHLNSEFPIDQINSAIKNELLFAKRALYNFEFKIVKDKNLAKYKKNFYIKRINYMLEDESLESSVVENTPSEIRTAYYEIIIKMRSLLSELKI